MVPQRPEVLREIEKRKAIFITLEYLLLDNMYVETEVARTNTLGASSCSSCSKVNHHYHHHHHHSLTLPLPWLRHLPPLHHCHPPRVLLAAVAAPINTSPADGEKKPPPSQTGTPGTTSFRATSAVHNVCENSGSRGVCTPKRRLWSPSYRRQAAAIDK